MYIFIVSLLCFLSSFIHGESLGNQANMRDLIIILDDVEETNPSKGGACILSISKALMGETVPFLVNPSLWRTFVELRQEWILRSQMPNSDIHAVDQYFAHINERINYWHGLLEGAGATELHTRSLIADKINEEFFTKEMCKKWQDTYKLPNDYNYFYTMTLCARFAIRYNFDAWYWFRLDTGYYLAIPKSYAAEYTKSSSYADILHACGFTACATDVINPLDTDPALHIDELAVENSIMPTLQQLFLPDKKHIWSLYVTGHGCYYKIGDQYRQRMAGISAAKFKEICQLCNTNILVHMLWINTCAGGGSQPSATE